MRIINSGKSESAMFVDFERIFVRYADVPTIARSALGPAARSASDAQMRAFTTAFQGYISRKYGRRFREFIGGRIEVTDAKPIKTYFEVISVAHLRGEPPFDLRWHVAERGGKPMFFNIIIEGVNMLATERTEIGAMLDRRRGDVNKTRRSVPHRPQHVLDDPLGQVRLVGTSGQGRVVGFRNRLFIELAIVGRGVRIIEVGYILGRNRTFGRARVDRDVGRTWNFRQQRACIDTFVHPRHHLVPDFRRQAATGHSGQRAVVVISHPDAHYIIGGKAHEPGIPRALRGAGLARGLAVIQQRPAAGAGVQHLVIM
jgi:phospholipid transport system substrate-binding protein